MGRQVGNKIYMIYNKFHIENCDEEECIELQNIKEFKKIKIENIYAYGKYWDFLCGGMSAKMKCYSHEIIEKEDVLYKIL